MNLIRLIFTVMIWIWVLLFPLSGSSVAQTYREIGLPPSEIFEKMIGYAQEKDFEKLRKTLQIIKPITQTLGNKYSKTPDEAIRTAIDKKDREKAVLSVQRLVALDLQDLLSIAVGSVRESSEKATTKFKAAYLDYLLISPYVQVKSFSADQKIKNTFRKTVTTSAKEDELKEMAEVIQKELFNACPELKP
ncbi:MAG: hypothetical protein HY036_07970 [Nitrospirae bacterium]|nr:hypothetical protein [Nitrospirota bacterium]MBI3352501.1 hypothetical protein [Nitrospirota bacterium]